LELAQLEHFVELSLELDDASARRFELTLEHRTALTSIVTRVAYTHKIDASARKSPFRLIQKIG
jgi:hypothetical protein